MLVWQPCRGAPFPPKRAGGQEGSFQEKPHPFLGAEPALHAAGKPEELVQHSPGTAWWEDGCPGNWEAARRRGARSYGQGLSLAHVPAQHRCNPPSTEEKVWAVNTSTPPLTRIPQKFVRYMEVMIKAEQLHSQNREDVSVGCLENDTLKWGVYLQSLDVRGEVAPRTIPGCRPKWNGICTVLVTNRQEKLIWIERGAENG